MSLRVGIGLLTLLLLISLNGYAADMTYQGKVIDADTLEPIEGAVVVAAWRETRAHIAGPDTRFKDAKETLTDKNGEWSLVGPKGETDSMNPYTSFLFGKYYLKDPYFIIYKPGYVSFGVVGSFSVFRAYPYVDKKHNLEGIVLRRPGDTREQREKHRKKYPIGSLPFIPVKDPERKLKELDFSFNYPENAMRIGSDYGYRRGIRQFWVYTVIGLRKAKTREKRLKAMRFSIGEKALPILDKIQSEERERLLGPRRIGDALKILS